MRRSISTRRCTTSSATMASGTRPPTTSPSITSPTTTTRCRRGLLNTRHRHKPAQPAGINTRCLGFSRVCLIVLKTPRRRQSGIAHYGADPMDLKLAGKVALITGSSRGIGLATAKAFAAEGCRLMLSARSAEQLHDAEAALRGTGAVAAHAGDVADPADSARLIDATV